MRYPNTTQTATAIYRQSKELHQMSKRGSSHSASISSFTKMPGVKDVNQHKFVVAFADFLKRSGKLKTPVWGELVKTAPYKQLSPANEDWYYIRCASLARHLYMRGPCGVQAFTKVYGGRKNNGTAPSHFAKSSKSIIRKGLQALEALKFVQVDEHTGGRKLTSEGRRCMDTVVNDIKA